MTMRKNYSRVLAVTMLVAMLAGVSCKKESGTTSSVRFSANVNEASTRTGYSSVLSSEAGVVSERIDWLTGDLITLYSPQASTVDGATHECDYRIVTVETLPDLQTSRATIEPVTGTGLQWGGGTNYFYAMYPAAATTGFTTEERTHVGLTTTEMKGTIPSAQSLEWNGQTGSPLMRYAYMFSSVTAPYRAGEVNLPFYPQFTAFEFTVTRGKNSSVALSSFTLETEETNGALAGLFSYPISAVSSTGTGNPMDLNSFVFENTTNSITVSLSGKTVSEGNDLTFTVLALPKNMTDLKITFTGTEIGTRSLSLKDSSGVPLSFDGRKKYRIRGLNFPSILTGEGEEIEWDVEAFAEDLIWDN